MEWGYTGEGAGMSSPRGKDLSHILEWSDEAEQDVEEDGITLKVRPPTRTYGGLKRVGGGLGGFSAGSSDSDEVGGKGGAGGTLGGGPDKGLVINDSLGILQGERSGSEDGDPGELLTGSALWEEEKAGPVQLAGLNLYAVGGRVRK
ncbi:hypothetical protein NDU88_007015 [Pleurodeles waltl]|uniref:Uncharacterized protein n=1 Tax=Pleurodeles waltl TaxID=8319 RepID=A0AAV7NZQ8_PLEWA|nr:hypothetical protein NDU88_007015 [Pleurodeles waltl]